MSTTKPSWTVQQKAAITQTGREVLVTASAGTGKTAVLSARCAELLAQASNPAQASQLLVLTFTEAAASEMKARIAKAVKEKYAATGDANLRKQVLLLDGADISTIDSFCKKLVTENFHKLAIDPAFRIIDPDEGQLVKSEILEQVLKEACEDQSLCNAVVDLFNCRQMDGQSNFSRSIIRIHDYLDGICWRDDWFEKSRQLVSDLPGKGPVADAQKELIAAKLGQIIEQLEHSCVLDNMLNPSKAWAAQIEADYIPAIKKAISAIKRNDHAGCAAIINDFEKSDWARKNKSLEKEIAELIKAPADKALKDFRSLGQLASLNPRYAEFIAKAEGRHTLTLIELVSRFSRLYSQRKKQLNCLDFADLEQNALKLLVCRDTSEPTELALRLREHYRYLLIDEFQDISMVQEAIIKSLGRGDNLFVVGDVKQSIYAWRQAQPEIFISRLKAASPFEDTQTGAPISIPLTSNFRSRGEILHFVNLVFEKIMTESFAGTDYDQTARLEGGSQYKPLREAALDGSSSPAVSMHLLVDDYTDEDDDPHHHAMPQNDEMDKTSARLRQAALVAKLIKDMVTGNNGSGRFEVVDRGSGLSRPVEYRDIVILMRSLSRNANEYAQVLRMHSIPVSSQSAIGYFETTEITDCITLLSVLDNPQKDIELAALLRGPFFRVDDSQLAHIRIGSRGGEQELDFYNAFKFYCASGADEALREKLAGIDTLIETWRSRARQGSISDLLWDIFKSTDFLAFVSALPNGAQRRANVLKFHQRAIEFENFVSCARQVTLARFIEFIQKLLDQGQDWSPAPPDTSADNAVGIISIHKSKGLEFPVVILAELNTKFNQSDMADQCLVDSDLGIGLKVISPAARKTVAGLAHQVIREKKKAQALAEEMRVLYVAMTRARERLILTASASKAEITRCVYNGALAQKALPAWMLSSCDRSIKWLLYSLAGQKKLLSAFEINLDAGAVDSDLFSLNVHGPQELLELSRQIEHLRTESRKGRDIAPSADSAKAQEMLGKFKSSMNWLYPFNAAAGIQAKTSVSDFLHKNIIEPRQYQEVLSDAPRTSQALSLDSEKAMLIGTATHLLLQRIDISGPVTRELIYSTLDGFVSSWAISDETAKAINIDGLLVFYQSSLGQMLFDKQNTIFRELPFTSALDASCFAYNTTGLEGEKVIVQGIIDLLIKTPNGLIIVDFKTDNVSASQASFRAQSYSDQLRLYASAASKAFDMPVIARFVYFLACGISIEIA